MERADVQTIQLDQGANPRISINPCFQNYVDFCLHAHPQARTTSRSMCSLPTLRSAPCSHSSMQCLATP